MSSTVKPRVARVSLPVAAFAVEKLRELKARELIAAPTITNLGIVIDSLLKKPGTLRGSALMDAAAGSVQGLPAWMADAIVKSILMLICLENAR
jgi:hypothetical protein